MCTKEVNALARAGVILLGEMDIKPTLPGRLMARYCVSFSTMKTFLQVGVGSVEMGRVGRRRVVVVTCVGAKGKF